MQAKLDAAVARLDQARADLAAGRKKIAEQQDTLGQIVVQNYQTGDPSLMGLSMVLTSQDPAELTGQLNSVQNVLDKESVVLDRLEASRALLTVQEQEVETAKVEVAKERKAAAENLLRKQGLEAQAEAAEQQVTSLVSLRERRPAGGRQGQGRPTWPSCTGLQQERTRIAAILKKRADEARRRAAAAARRAGQASGPILGDNGPTHSSGFLDYPVQSARSPRRSAGASTRSTATARCTTASTSAPPAARRSARPPPARSCEQYFQTAWGNRVIIDHGFHHGVGLATITNHMVGPAIVSPGQHVDRGQIVGYVGTTGWSTGCHLHYTVLQNGSPVDPMNWF